MNRRGFRPNERITRQGLNGKLVEAGSYQVRGRRVEQRQGLRRNRDQRETMKNLLWLLAAALSMVAVRDILRAPRDRATKMVLIVIVLVPFVGAGLHLFALRERRPF